MGVVIKQVFTKITEVKPPLKLAVIVHASFIKEALELLE